MTMNRKYNELGLMSEQYPYLNNHAYHLKLIRICSTFCPEYALLCGCYACLFVHSSGLFPVSLSIVWLFRYTWCFGSDQEFFLMFLLPFLMSRDLFHIQAFMYYYAGHILKSDFSKLWQISQSHQLLWWTIQQIYLFLLPVLSEENAAFWSKIQ